ncbi:MAG: ferrous iron transport protein A [Verrucomicrobiales bacterium]|nr:ferrous iron transport protein A [Verrucomicrobiales bacterium]
MIADRQTFPLRDLKPNVIAVVHDFVEGTRNRIRFAELGLLPGREIQVLRKAPLGDPLEIQVGETLLSIRKREAESIVVSLDHES